MKAAAFIHFGSRFRLKKLDMADVPADAAFVLRVFRPFSASASRDVKTVTVADRKITFANSAERIVLAL